MHLSSDDVAKIVQEVWSSMLGLEVTTADADYVFAGDAIAGSVSVSGSTECLISVEFDASGARQFGAAMFGMTNEEIGNEDITDAAGELTNMIGGNIKCLLPEPSTLSLPVVAKGTIPPTLKVVGAKVLLDEKFVCDGHPIFVTVWNRPS